MREEFRGDFRRRWNIQYFLFLEVDIGELDGY